MTNKEIVIWLLTNFSDEFDFDYVATQLENKVNAEIDNDSFRSFEFQLDKAKELFKLGKGWEPAVRSCLNKAANKL